MSRNLGTFTEIEKVGLKAVVNLADAHARQDLSRTQLAIIERLPQLFRRGESESYDSLVQDFLGKFFLLAGQGQVPALDRIFLSYSASCAIDMISLICSERQFVVGLIEPCFDNISNFLLRRGVRLVALSESALLREGMVRTSLKLDAVWIVSPNNPTGLASTEASFRSLARWCSLNQVLLILDLCFRFFSDETLRFRQYEVLLQEGTSYIAIEDTGKTWPVLDIKCGITLASDDYVRELYVRHDDLILNVSPLSLVLLSEFMADTLVQGVEASLRKVYRMNRGIVLQALSPFRWIELRQLGDLPVLWLESTHPRINGRHLHQALSARGVEVLPGTNFFWSKRHIGDKFIRIALNRPAKLFKSGVEVIYDTCRQLESEINHESA